MYIISDFKLDVDAPYPPPPPLTQSSKPERLQYHDKEIEYELNHIMTFIIHFRIIFLIRNLLHYTIYINPRAFRMWSDFHILNIFLK